MAKEIVLRVNGRVYHVDVDPETPLLYVLRNDLGLKGVKYACGLEQCGACKVLVDGQATPSCRLAVKSVAGLTITTPEGLGTAETPHPLQQAFIDEQAGQCGYCTPGMVIAIQGLLNRSRHPTDAEIREALADNLCRCGIYHRALRAVRRRIGRPAMEPIWEIRQGSATGPGPDLLDTLPGALQETPDLDAWIRLNTDKTITLFTGKVEYGQGIKTALAQVAAEELDVSLARIRVVMADTAQTPDEGLTVSSMSLETSGQALRYAAAEARHRLLLIAYEELEAPLERLVVNDGTIIDPVTGRTVTYWDLAGGRPFGVKIADLARPKRPEAYWIVGQPVLRLDLPGKATGDACFVHDLTLPGMVHGRVVRPPGYGARLVSAGVAAASKMPGVLKVIRDGHFLAIIAEREEQAIKAAEALGDEAAWDNQTNLPPQEELFDNLLNGADRSILLVDGTAVSDPVPPIGIPAEAAQTLKATYTRPYHMHASLAPSAAVACMEDGMLTVWAHSQGVFPQRAAIAHVLGLAEENVRVIHLEGAGCYGHNGADDAALDAALLSRALPGRPVSLKWTRADEHAWEPYGPAMVIQMQASLDKDGQVIDWHHDIWSTAHLGRSRSGPRISGLLAARHLAEPFSPPDAGPALFTHGGEHRNADPLYTFPHRRIVKHYVPNSPLRTSSLRSLGAYANVFAIESFVDELAHAARIDPVAFRLKYLADERAGAVVEAAADKAGWQAGKRSREDERLHGRGLAFAQYKNRQCYAAVVVELSVNPATGHIQLKRVVIAADAGLIVNPDGLSNQLEGGFIQAASWTLMEEVRYDRDGITSVDWESYPILRFTDAPEIETVLINRPDQPATGSGEATIGPAGAAIANAVFDATGARLRHIPFTAGRVKAALSEAYKT